MTQQNQIENIPLKKFQFKNGHRYRPNEINSATNSIFQVKRKKEKNFLFSFYGSVTMTFTQTRLHNKAPW